MFTAKITGVRDLDRALKRLELKLAKTVVAKGTKAGAKLMQQAVVSRTPIGQGPEVEAAHRRFQTKPLRSSWKVKAWRGRRNPAVGYKVQVGSPKKKGEDKAQAGAFYGTFRVYGTKLMEGDPFLKAAFESSKKQAEAATMAAIRAELESIRAIEPTTPST